MANIAEPIPTGSSITTKEGAIKLGIKDTTGGIVKMDIKATTGGTIQMEAITGDTWKLRMG